VAFPPRVPVPVRDMEGREGSSGHQKSLAFQVEQAEEGDCGTRPCGTRMACALSPLAGIRDKHARDEMGWWQRLGLKLQGHPGPSRPLPALSRESLRVGSSMVLKINVLSVMKTTLFT